MDTDLIKGSTGLWEYVIGLEVHAQIPSKTKLFSKGRNAYGMEPNSGLSWVDLAMPGMLPVLNAYCVEMAIKTGIGLNGNINKTSTFHRKNYFYPDLPQGYQISQYNLPIVYDGYIDVGERRIRIERLHLEQDAGKSLHDHLPKYTLLDFNRAGCPLMEIVSAPDLRSPSEAAEYVKKLRNILRYIGSCDGDMEKGSLRCDANVSVRKVGEVNLGTRCEIKNINSFRNIAKAIEFEAQRQVDLIEGGGSVVQETRLFDADKCETRSMRNKEEAYDYRYFPDPDLLPLVVDDGFIERIKQSIGELPDERCARYRNMGVSEYDASVLAGEREISDYFEQAAGIANPKMVANWIISELFGHFNKSGEDFSTCKIKPHDLAELINLINDGTISSKTAKEVFAQMAAKGDKPSNIVSAGGMTQISDKKEIESIVQAVLDDNQDSVRQYKEGKDKLFPFFVGQIMKRTGGKANPTIISEILTNLLSK